jgi:hypothetical protein
MEALLFSKNVNIFKETFTYISRYFMFAPKFSWKSNIFLSRVKSDVLTPPYVIRCIVIGMKIKEHIWRKYYTRFGRD